MELLTVDSTETAAELGLRRLPEFDWARRRAWMLPTVDFTETAAELGLRRLPEFDWVWDLNLRLNAEFRPDSNEIRVHPSLYHEWHATGMPESVRIHNAKNGLRFTVAHELAHAWQNQRDPSLFLFHGPYHAEMRREELRVRPGMTRAQKSQIHRRFNKFEAEADAIARQIWRKVKVK